MVVFGAVSVCRVIVNEIFVYCLLGVEGKGWLDLFFRLVWFQ